MRLKKTQVEALKISMRANEVTFHTTEGEVQLEDVVEDWLEANGFLEAIANKINEELKTFSLLGKG